jgi:urease beta subunit
MRLLARLEGLTTASFFLYMAICVHFPFDREKGMSYHLDIPAFTQAS